MSHCDIHLHTVAYVQFAPQLQSRRYGPTHVDPALSLSRSLGAYTSLIELNYRCSYRATTSNIAKRTVHILARAKFYALLYLCARLGERGIQRISRK